MPSVFRKVFKHISLRKSRRHSNATDSTATELPSNSIEFKPFIPKEAAVSYPSLLTTRCGSGSNVLAISQFPAIFILPPEILCQIFVLCLPRCLDYGDNELGWLALTQVCTRWRDTALDTAQLWSIIPLSHLKYFQHTISRARTTRLTLRAKLWDGERNPWGTTERGKFQDVLISCVHQLGTIELHDLAWSTHMPTIISSFSTIPPLLESLTLRMVDDVRHPSADVWLLDNLRDATSGARSQNIQHRLRHLSLDGCSFAWNSAWYKNKNLTSLSLTNIANPPSFTTFLSLFLGMPQLRALVLLRVVPMREQVHFCVTLPELAELTLHDPFENLFLLLGSLNLPSLCSLSLTACLSIKDDVAMQQFLVHKHLPNLSIKCRSMSLDFGDSLDGYGYDSLAIRLLVADHVVFHLRLEYPEHGSGGADITPIILSVCQRLVRPSVTHLSIRNSPAHFILRSALDRTHDRFWTRLFTLHLRSLQDLEMHGSVPVSLMRTILGSWMSKIGIGMWESEYGQVLPQVKRFRLHSLNCAQLMRAGVFKPTGEEPSLADALRAFLWARRQCGVKDTHVEISHCRGLYKQDISHISFLAYLEWDKEGELNFADKDDPGIPVDELSTGVFLRMQHSIVAEFDRKRRASLPRSGFDSK